MLKFIMAYAFAVFTILLGGCGGSGPAPATPSQANYQISGTLTGLNQGAAITLSNQFNAGSDTIQVGASGTFEFQSVHPSGSSYSIIVNAQPTGEFCSVTNGNGIIGASNVTNINVACTENATVTYAIGGTVSGLIGTLVLQDNAGEPTTISANGPFAMKTALVNQASYAVTVAPGGQPTGQTCLVTGGAGTVQAAKVSNIGISCTSNPPSSFTIGGSISGLAGSVVLQNFDGSSLQTFNSNGVFTLSSTVQPGNTYNVQVITQPDGQVCTVTNPSGTMGNANVANITVSCAEKITYSVKAYVTGLSAGNAITLADNGSDQVTATSNGTLTFPTQLAPGANYAISVKQQPSGQTCVVSNGSGAVGTVNVSNIQVQCSVTPVPTYMIGGTVSGLVGSLTVRNGSDQITATSNGPLTFPTQLAPGANYAISVTQQPSGQTCVIFNGSGTVGTVNVSNIQVQCSVIPVPTYMIGGTVSGLVGSLTVRNNGDSKVINANGAFTMNAPLLNGGHFQLTVSSQPNGQNCSVNNGIGTVNGANINSVGISCANVVIAGPATVSKLTAIPQSKSSILVQWVASDDGASQVLLRQTSGGQKQLLATLSSSTQSYVDTGLSSGTSYTYQVIRTLNAQSTSSPTVTQSPYSGPITITQGGTYTGNWMSTDVHTPAVTIKTTAPVVINGCFIQSVTDGITAYAGGAQLTVTNCQGYALNPNINGQTKGNFIAIAQFVSVDAEHNNIEGYAIAVRALNWLPGYSGQTVKILYNKVKNADGRQSDGNGGYISNLTFKGGQAFQLNTLIQVHADIGWNEIINDPWQSMVEDVISPYESGGAMSDPILIHDNYIQGGYSSDPVGVYPNGSGYSGSMINLGDCPSNSINCGFVTATNNHVVNFSNLGIALSGGHDMKVFNNWAVSAQKTPQGIPINSPWRNGFSYINYYKNPYWANNYLYNNTAAVINASGTRVGNYIVTPATAQFVHDNTTGLNVVPIQPVTSDAEQTEYRTWLQSVSNNNLTIGVP